MKNFWIGGIFFASRGSAFFGLSTSVWFLWSAFLLLWLAGKWFLAMFGWWENSLLLWEVLLFGLLTSVWFWEVFFTSGELLGNDFSHVWLVGKFFAFLGIAFFSYATMKIVTSISSQFVCIIFYFWVLVDHIDSKPKGKLGFHFIFFIGGNFSPFLWSAFFFFGGGGLGMNSVWSLGEIFCFSRKCFYFLMQQWRFSLLLALDLCVFNILFLSFSRTYRFKTKREIRILVVVFASVFWLAGIFFLLCEVLFFCFWLVFALSEVLFYVCWLTGKWFFCICLVGSAF